MKKEDPYNDLFEKTKKGDQDAYHKLYKQFYAPLCIYALRYINDTEVSRDCVQDVFLKIWRDRESISVNYSIRAYLLNSIRNTCFNLIEKKRIHQTYEQHILNTYSTFNEEDLYSIEELSSMVDDILDSFPERQKEIFKMSRLENLKNKEIAEKLDISIKTVESNITKSLKTFSSKLGKHYPDIILIYFIHFLIKNM